MRRTVGLIAVGLGVFLVVTAPLVKWYMAPRAARVPLGLHSVSTAVSDGRSVVLDKGTLKIRSGLTLTSRQVVQGDGAAGSSRVAVWDTLARVSDADGALISARTERIAFDRITGMAVNCCDEQLNGVGVKHEGLTYKFPLDTAKKEYPYYDGETKRAWPMVFKGEENALGLSLYHFTQTIPALDVETLDAPLSLLGKPGNGSISVHRYYESVTDLLVEPTTGVIIRGGSHQVQTLRDAAGQSLLTVADINATLDEASQKGSADQARTAIFQLRMVRYYVPIGSVILGLGLVIRGLMLAGVIAGRRRAAADDDAAPRPSRASVSG